MAHRFCGVRYPFWCSTGIGLEYGYCVKTIFKTHNLMKGFNMLIASIALFFALNLSAQQSVLPALVPNAQAKQRIENEIGNLKQAHQANPSSAISSKIDLFSRAIEFLGEGTIIPPTTEYALTSAFLNHEVDFNQANDSEAFYRFYNKQWKQEFIDLVNLVKS